MPQIELNTYGHYINLDADEVEATKQELTKQQLETYYKRQEIEIHRVLLGIITAPEDIKEYHDLYEKLKDGLERKPSESYNDSVEKWLKLLAKYRIQIWVAPQANSGWHLPIWAVLKDNQLIAEII